MKSLKQIIAEFTCPNGCGIGLHFQGNHHVFYCNTPACQPGGRGEGHYRSCTSLANNAKFIKAIRKYFKGGK